VKIPYQAERQAAGKRAPQPTLYLHGSADGCIGVDLVRDARRHLGPGSEVRVIQDAGHFPPVEQPGQVNQHILAWVTS
jgi:pimeloyl-ACP methyl ester carboxylesterase